LAEQRPHHDVVRACAALGGLAPDLAPVLTLAGEVGRPIEQGVLGEHAEDRRDVGQPRVTDGGPLAAPLPDLEPVRMVGVAVVAREPAGHLANLELAAHLDAHSEPPPSSASSASAWSGVSESTRAR